MRALALFLLLTLPGWAETQVRSLKNDSDASVELRLGETAIGTFERFGQGTLKLSLPESDGSTFLELKTRAGVTRLYANNGLIYARVNDLGPRPISNRVNEYVTLFVDTQGNLRVRRWEYWYS